MELLLRRSRVIRGRHIPARARFGTSSKASRPQHADGLWRIHPEPPGISPRVRCRRGRAGLPGAYYITTPRRSGVPRGGRQRRRRPGHAGTVTWCSCAWLLQRRPSREVQAMMEEQMARAARASASGGHVRRVRAYFRTLRLAQRGGRAAARRAHAVLRAAAVRRAIAAVRCASATYGAARRGRRAYEIRNAPCARGGAPQHRGAWARSRGGGDNVSGKAGRRRGRDRTNVVGGAVVAQRPDRYGGGIASAEPRDLRAGQEP